MIEKKVVVFTTNNARIIPNPSPEELLRLSEFLNVAIDPDLSLVGGVPPHFWKLQDGAVLPMNDTEKTLRMRHIDKFGIDNAIQHLKIKQTRPRTMLAFPIEIYLGWLIHILFFLYIIYLIRGTHL